MDKRFIRRILFFILSMKGTKKSKEQRYVRRQDRRCQYLFSWAEYEGHAPPLIRKMEDKLQDVGAPVVAPDRETYHREPHPL